MPVTKLEYATLEEQLEAAGAPVSLAELHGALCGLFCAAGRDAAGRWLTEQVAALQGDDETVGRAAAAVQAFESSSWSALSDPAMEFVPLLPDDDIALATRATALGQWCLGFMGGLALGGWRETEDETDGGEVTEILHDFIEISKAHFGSEDQADVDAAEFSYLELAEFVRVGVLVVFESLAHPVPAAGSPTLH